MKGTIRGGVRGDPRCHRPLGEGSLLLLPPEGSPRPHPRLPRLTPQPGARCSPVAAPPTLAMSGNGLGRQEKGRPGLMKLSAYVLALRPWSFSASPGSRVPPGEHLGPFQRPPRHPHPRWPTSPRPKKKAPGPRPGRETVAQNNLTLDRPARGPRPHLGGPARRRIVTLGGRTPFVPGGRAASPSSILNHGGTAGRGRGPTFSPCPLALSAAFL
ncbi:hypothetical protein GWK47_023892 [Chionoecetes opilio]|uniref:Uncharacterized protein n=1 Tax=Chionoecetes opilio TaxID=41210 RepID=A0A8J4XM10_CHIOP|nr:hypothetical protein GWK47_023892 [Chionoecetes opilio]